MEKLITMIMALYGQVKVGLHHGSAASPLLFIILLDYISKQCPIWSENRSLPMVITSVLVPTQKRSGEVPKCNDRLAACGIWMSKVKTEVMGNEQQHSDA